MNVAEYHSNKDIQIKQIERPSITENEILVSMKACGICGTDVMEWYRAKNIPRILGHEMSGEVVEVGENVDTISKHDRVFVSHHIPCFDCYYCHKGNHSACNSLHTGNFFPGGFSEYIRIPENNVKYGTFVLPQKMSYEEASMIEPMACAVAGQKMIKIQKNETVIILGSGISGLTHVQLSKNIGSKVITTDVSKYRLEQSKKFGADHSFHANDLNIDEIKKINNDRLADKVIVCTVNESAIQSAFEYVDKKGSILFFAVPSENISIPSVRLWRDEISIFFSYGAVPDDIEETFRLADEKKIDLNSMITHSLPLSKIVEGFKLVSDADESMKVVITSE
tara:strand:+ start:477 stop:1490 length:1014 start_codon:yes stop_codon:yes gene_type:complete